MYTIINSLIANIKPITAEYSADALSHLIDLEKIADEYNSYNRINTRYSNITEIDGITDKIISNVENDFYMDDDIYDTVNANKVINAVYDIYSAFEEWTEEMSSNSYSVSFWNA